MGLGRMEMRTEQSPSKSNFSILSGSARQSPIDQAKAKAAEMLAHDPSVDTADSYIIDMMEEEDVSGDEGLSGEEEEDGTDAIGASTHVIAPTDEYEHYHHDL